MLIVMESVIHSMMMIWTESVTIAMSMGSLFIHKVQRRAEAIVVDVMAADIIEDIASTALCQVKFMQTLYTKELSINNASFIW